MTDKPKPPVAYSYNVGSDGDTTGHTVTIAPGTLQASIDKFTDDAAGKSPVELTNLLKQALLVEGDFGTIPNSPAVMNQVNTFIQDHANVMAGMGNVLADFVARVQAAAQLGYLTDPETRRQMAWARAHER